MDNKISETSTFKQHTKSNRQQLIGEINELKQEAEQLLDSYRQGILDRTDLILKHAEEYEDSTTVQCDKQKMSDIVDMLYELDMPLHPYCNGCNREHGGPHYGQRQHMGRDGCLNT